MSRPSQHDPYGGIQKVWVNTYDPRAKFSGKEREKSGELDYFGARYYDHLRYRFLSVDPLRNKDKAITDPQSWNLYSYCRNNPITLFDPDGREEGSWSNVWTRMKISYGGLKYDNSTAWGKNSSKDDFPAGSWKCNKFVYDVTKEAGATAEIETGNIARIPRAGEWANRSVNIPDWRVLGLDEKVLPGDVAAYEIQGGGSEFSGHCGLMIVGKDGRLMNISAHSDSVGNTPGQFEQNPGTVYRRYTGDGEM